VDYVFLDLQRRLAQRDVLVNFVWLRQQSLVAGEEDMREREGYSATYWRKSSKAELAKQVEVPWVCSENIDGVARGLIEGLEEEQEPTGPYFYVCCHGKRDCRCGIRGSVLATDISNELRARGMLIDAKGRTRIGELGHVGGHKFVFNQMKIFISNFFF
jgi:hypothetical protein